MISECKHGMILHFRIGTEDSSLHQLVVTAGSYSGNNSRHPVLVTPTTATKQILDKICQTEYKLRENSRGRGNSMSESLRSQFYMQEEIERLEGIKQNMQRPIEDDQDQGIKLQNLEDIAKVQFDILSRLSRFERTLDFPQTDIQGVVNQGRAIDDNHRIILRGVNEISRNIISSGLIYRTVNTGEAQEVLEAITVQIRDLRSLLGLGDHDINLLQPEGQYPVSYLHTNLQIASFYLQGLVEQIDQLVLSTAISDLSGTTSQQDHLYGVRKSQLHFVDDDSLKGYDDDSGGDDDSYDYEAFRRDEDYEYDYYESRTL